MSISKFRSILYTTAKIAGDVSAVNDDRISKRIFNRILGKFTARLFR